MGKRTDLHQLFHIELQNWKSCSSLTCNQVHNLSVFSQILLPFSLIFFAFEKDIVSQFRTQTEFDSVRRYA